MPPRSGRYGCARRAARLAEEHPPPLDPGDQPRALDRDRDEQRRRCRRAAPSARSRRALTMTARRASRRRARGRSPRSRTRSPGGSARGGRRGAGELTIPGRANVAPPGIRAAARPGKDQQQPMTRTTPRSRLRCRLRVGGSRIGRAARRIAQRSAAPRYRRGTPATGSATSPSTSAAAHRRAPRPPNRIRPNPRNIVPATGAGRAGRVPMPLDGRPDRTRTGAAVARRSRGSSGTMIASPM